MRPGRRRLAPPGPVLCQVLGQLPLPSLGAEIPMQAAGSGESLGFLSIVYLGRTQRVPE